MIRYLKKVFKLFVNNVQIVYNTGRQPNAHVRLLYAYYFEQAQESLAVAIRLNNIWDMAYDFTGMD